MCSILETATAFSIREGGRTEMMSFILPTKRLRSVEVTQLPKVRWLICGRFRQLLYLISAPYLGDSLLPFSHFFEFYDFSFANLLHYLTVEIFKPKGKFKEKIM